jgi:hypothetical protein
MAPGIRTNANKHKAISHERILKSETQLEAEMFAACVRPNSLLLRKTAKTALTSLVMSLRRNKSGQQEVGADSQALSILFQQVVQ